MSWVRYWTFNFLQLTQNINLDGKDGDKITGDGDDGDDGGDSTDGGDYTSPGLSVKKTWFFVLILINLLTDRLYTSSDISLTIQLIDYIQFITHASIQ